MSSGYISITPCLLFFLTVKLDHFDQSFNFLFFLPLLA
ncbi:hypothetical protein DSUL_50395 [Desulfovibrionales bacterium]